MRSIPITWWCKACFLAIGAISVYSTPCMAGLVVNGGFESGDLSGWESVGSASAEFTLGVTPPEGLYVGLIQSNDSLTNSASINDIELLLGLSAGSIQATSSEPVIQGSAISQIVTVGAGDVLTFSYAFLTNNDPIPDGVFNDFGFISVAPLGGITRLADTFSTFGVSPTALFTHATEFQNKSITFASGGTFRIGFGAVDVGDDSFSSALVVDGISIEHVSAVPEPASVSLMHSSLVAGTLWHFSRCRAKASIL